MFEIVQDETKMKEITLIKHDLATATQGPGMGSSSTISPPTIFKFSQFAVWRIKQESEKACKFAWPAIVLGTSDEGEW